MYTFSLCIDEDFNMHLGTLGPLVSAPGSPSRLINIPQNTSFPLLPQLSSAVGSQVNHGPSTLGNNVVAVNNMNRVQSQASPIEKSRLGKNVIQFSVFHIYQEKVLFLQFLLFGRLFN